MPKNEFNVCSTFLENCLCCPDICAYHDKKSTNKVFENLGKILKRRLYKKNLCFCRNCLYILENTINLIYGILRYLKFHGHRILLFGHYVVRAKS